jgi:hypothetical protein
MIYLVALAAGLGGILVGIFVGGFTMLWLIDVLGGRP